jgi:predicted phage tail protein
MSELIRGAGGGGGGGGGGGAPTQQTTIIQQTVVAPTRTPVRDPDTLASKQYATIVDLLGEGEIEGFPSARDYTRGTDNYNKALLKDIFLDGTPILRSGADVTNLQAADYNYSNVNVQARYGTQAQTYISGFSDIENEVSVSTIVQKDTPLTRTITDSNTDAVRVTISVPRLEVFTNDGDVRGTSINLQIQIQYNGGGYTTKIDDTISGRTADQYQKDYKIALDGAFPVDVRVVRVTADATDNNTQNAFFWSSYTEIIEEKLRYPNSALMAIRLDAEQFSSIPSRTFRVRGIKVQIPSNGTVDQTTGAISYSGTWDGTFGAAVWTSDPAWLLYSLLTNTRWGLGDHIDAAQLDKFAFYSASQYCGASVDDGFGGTEPRFSCNALIQNQEEAYKLINDLCSVMRVMPYWSTGALTISQDKPADPSYLFTLSNVSDAGFTYTGSDLKTRHTVAVVSYLDMQTKDLAYEVVEDQDAIAKYGVITTNVRAFACTSRGQAARLGEWLLYSEQAEGQVVQFTTSIDAGVLVRPGQVIEIADPVKAGVRRGGRIASATSSVVTVDDSSETDLVTTGSATLSVILPDGTVESRAISSISGAAVTVASNFTTAPNANSVWVISNDTVQTSTWRVLTVAETEPAQYEVTALEYNSSKFDHVERGFKLQTRDITTLNEPRPAPSNLTASEKIYESNNQVRVKLIVSWRSVVGVSEYRVQWRPENGNWTTITVPRTDYEILDTTAQKYEIRVYSLNGARTPSTTPASLDINAIGKTAVPADVQNLRFEATSDKEGKLTWDETTDLDVKIGGKVYIRHSSKTDGSGTWSNSVDLIEAVAGSSTSAKIPLIEGEVLVKFADDGGRLSTNETSVIIDLPDALGKLILETRREDQDAPPFQGTRTNTFYSDEFDALTLDGTDDIDDVTDVDEMPVFDTIGDIEASGTYDFATTLDLGNVFSLDLKRYFVTRGYYPNDLMDTRSENVDSWDNWDGDVVDKVNAKLNLRRTNDDPSGTPTWSAWQDFSNGTFKGRAFQFRADLTSSDVAQNILVDELGYTAEFQRRTEQSDGSIASGAGAKAIGFGSAFFVGTSSLGGTNAYVPSIGITAENMQTGDFFELSSITGSGFTVTFKNSGGTAVDRNFRWQAIGYGKSG